MQTQAEQAARVVLANIKLAHINARGILWTVTILANIIIAIACRLIVRRGQSASHHPEHAAIQHLAPDKFFNFKFPTHDLFSFIKRKMRFG